MAKTIYPPRPQSVKSTTSRNLRPLTPADPNAPPRVARLIAPPDANAMTYAELESLVSRDRIVRAMVNAKECRRLIKSVACRPRTSTPDARRFADGIAYHAGWSLADCRRAADEGIEYKALMMERGEYWTNLTRKQIRAAVAKAESIRADNAPRDKRLREAPSGRLGWLWLTASRSGKRYAPISLREVHYVRARPQAVHEADLLRCEWRKHARRLSTTPNNTPEQARIRRRHSDTYKFIAAEEPGILSIAAATHGWRLWKRRKRGRARPTKLADCTGVVAPPNSTPPPTKLADCTGVCTPSNRCANCEAKAAAADAHWRALIAR